MFVRIGVITLNTYREAVRARILLAIFWLALAAAAYSTVVGAYSLRRGTRVVSDVGAASISGFAVVVAIALAATSLYREVELKTLYPILTRPIARTEYLVGKYLGILLTVVVFVAADAGATMALLAGFEGHYSTALVMVNLTWPAAIAAWRFQRWSSWLPIPWALMMLVLGWIAAGPLPDDRWVVVGLSGLAVLEVGIVTAIAMLFASFSSPFLTGALTFCVFLVGRSAGTLAHMPEKVFGPTVQQLAQGLSRVFPNLMVYVPPRSLLTGEVQEVHWLGYVGYAGLQSVAWAIALLAAASIIFRRRDFL